MGIEQDSKWYDENIWNSEKKLLYNRKHGLYEEAYKFLEGNEILDLGCGSGRMARVLEDNEFKGHYTGVDFSERAIEYCRETYKFYDFLLLNIFEKSLIGYSTILCLEVLEHIDNDLKLLENIPFSTTVVFSVPSFDGISHVRYFNDIENVENRYSFLLSFIDHKTIERVFLFKAVRA